MMEAEVRKAAVSEREAVRSRGLRSRQDCANGKGLGVQHEHNKTLQIVLEKSSSFLWDDPPWAADPLLHGLGCIELDLRAPLCSSDLGG